MKCVGLGDGRGFEERLEKQPNREITQDAPAVLRAGDACCFKM